MFNIDRLQKKCKLVMLKDDMDYINRLGEYKNTYHVSSNDSASIIFSCCNDKTAEKTLFLPPSLYTHMHAIILVSFILSLYHVYFFVREDGAKVFMQSAKTKHLRRSQVLSRLWRNEQAGDDGDDDQPYTHQLSLPAAPSRLSKTSFEDREIIASNTRNIAALAARRRTQANASNQVIYLGGRPLYRPVPDAVEDFPMVLTPSRLAQHNRLTEDGAYLNFSDDNLSQNTVEKTSVHTDNSLPPLLGSEPQYTYKKGDSAEKKNTGSYIHEVSIGI